MTQFTVYPAPRRPGLIVDVQSGLLDEIGTRVVIPLVPHGLAPPVLFKTLNPTLRVDEKQYVLMTQMMGSLRKWHLREPIGTLQVKRDEIIRAIDALLSGI